jgi:hypothetical protein
VWRRNFWGWLTGWAKNHLTTEITYMLPEEHRDDVQPSAGRTYREKQISNREQIEEVITHSANAD